MVPSFASNGKQKILNWTEALTDTNSKPVAKPVAEVGSYKVLRNLVALAMLSWAMQAEEQYQSEELIQRGKRQKDKRRHRPKFPFL